MNEKKFSEIDFELVYHSLYNIPDLNIALDKTYIKIIDYLEKELEKDNYLVIQAWEKLRQKHGIYIRELVDFVIPPWELCNLVSKEERSLIHTLSILCIIHDCYSSVKNKWDVMTAKQKKQLLYNSLQLYDTIFDKK